MPESARPSSLRFASEHPELGTGLLWLEDGVQKCGRVYLSLTLSPDGDCRFSKWHVSESQVVILSGGCGVSRSPEAAEGEESTRSDDLQPRTLK